MKKISDYNIPKHYIDVIEDFYSFLKKNYEDRIFLFSLSGSTVFENIVENISDIDYFLILDKCSPDDYRNIYQYKNQFDIKIGGSIFTYDEFIYKQIDYLVMYYLYLIKIGYIEPVYVSDSFFNCITKKDMLDSIRNVVILNLRTLKKIVYSRNIRDSKILMKNILFLEKDFLILNDLYCKSKGDVIDNFNRMFNIDFELSIMDCLDNRLSDEQICMLLNYIDEIVVCLNNVNFNDKILVR